MNINKLYYRCQIYYYIYITYSKHPMSKAKSKSKKKGDKKKDQSIVDMQLESKQRKILQSDFTIRKLQDRLDRLILDNKAIQQKFEEGREQNQSEILKLKMVIDSKQSDINDLTTKLSLSEMENKQKQSKIKNLEIHLNQQIEKKNKEFENLRITSLNDIKIFEAKLKDYQNYMNEKDNMQKDAEKLREMLDNEKTDRIRQLADKDREKVLATDKLKNDMLHKIQETKTNLLALKKQQLSTTTRLTVLQNHQLTSELEYQSKQTEKLLFKNEELQNKVTNLQRDLQIHKQVEQELAKRSNFSRGIIKKLTQKVQELQQKLDKKQSQQTTTMKPQSKTSHMKEDRKRSQTDYLPQKNLEKLEKNFSKLQSDYEILKNQNYYLQTRVQQFQSKIQKIGNLLVKYTQEILDGVREVKDEKYTYDLRELKKKDVKDWVKEDVKLTVDLLLNLIKPLLTKKNITFSIPALNKNLIILDEEEPIVLNSLSLPKIANLDGPSSAHKQRKTEIKSRLHEVPLNVATKIVGSSLREWGKSLTTGGSSSINLSKKFKINESIK